MDTHGRKKRRILMTEMTRQLLSMAYAIKIVKDDDDG